MKTITVEDGSKALLVDIQDMLVGRFAIPHHIEPGYNNPHTDQLSDVRAIDIHLIIQVREDKQVHFYPGSPRSNIECIVYSCILLNDLLGVNDISSLLPDKPEEIHIDLPVLLSMIEADNLPSRWFIYYRDKMILASNITVELGASHDPFILKCGISWANMLHEIHNIVRLLELDHDKHKSDKTRVDYSYIKSRPHNCIINENKADSGIDRLNDNFLKETQRLFGK